MGQYKNMPRMEKHMPCDLQNHSKPIMRSKRFPSAVSNKILWFEKIFDCFEQSLSFYQGPFSVLKVFCRVLKMCLLFKTGGSLAIRGHSKVSRGIWGYCSDRRPCFKITPLLSESPLLDQLRCSRGNFVLSWAVLELVEARPGVHYIICSAR